MSCKQLVSSTALETTCRYGVFIYGTGGHAKVVERMLDQRYPVLFVDDAREAVDFGAGGHRVLKDWTKIPLGSHVIPAIGDNHLREQIVQRLKDRQVSFRGVHHKRAYWEEVPGEYAQLCANSVLMAGVQLGKFAIINTAATVDHDCVLGDFVHIAPGVNLCGNVHVGDRTLIGVGSCVRPGITIGSDTIIGAGSVVVHDIPSGVIAHGNPCRVIKHIS